jgi:dihydrofolate reductase
MGRVLWHVTMSLDGFIAGPDDEMDWVRRGDEPVRWHEGDLRWGLVRTGLRLTHRPPDASDDPAVTSFSDGIDNAVAAALAAAGGKNVGILGANTAQQCVRAGLLDEIVVHAAPILLGDGIRFFGGPGVGRVGLERTTPGRVGSADRSPLPGCEVGRRRPAYWLMYELAAVRPRTTRRRSTR